MKNMKKVQILFSFIISIQFLFAQDCKYAEYYPLVTAATKDYNKKKYKEAENKLKLAFSKVDFPLGKDLNLALLISQKNKNSEWSEQIAIQLAKGGVPFRYFVKLKSFKWFDKFESDFKTYSDYYNQNFKPELRQELLSLIERDKKFNDKNHEWREKKIEMSLQELIDGSYEILLDLNKLTDKYGFPNERLIGYNYIRGRNSVETYNTSALLIHIYQRGIKVLKNDLQKIICEGGLHPNYEEILNKTSGFGDSTGIEQEMEIRYAKYRGKK
jgi:hypothetical protein